MNRKITYLIEGEEVDEIKWFDTFSDEENLKTLTLKFEDLSDRSCIEELEEINKQLAELQKERENWNSTPVYPWTYPDLGRIECADWTVRPEHMFVYEITPNNPNRFIFSTTC